MTSKISLFNKGIYKSTVRRYIWGGVLYAILLFMSTAMAILFGIDPEYSIYRTMDESGVPLLLDDIYFFLPVIMAMLVPTVVSLLVFRFVHSKKTAIFVHSLPVSRTANYVSSLMAAFTLMAIPVIINGAILLIMSCTAYGEFFDVASCFVWMGMNLLTLFLMFSVSVLAAMLTGNSFALVGLNGLIHGFVILIAVCFSQLCDIFLFGHFSTKSVVEASAKWNFVHYLVKLADELSYGWEKQFEFVTFIIMVLLAIVLYICALMLYRKRRMETAEDVAAFRCLNPIYKYLLTFITALTGFGLFGYMMETEPLLPILVSAIAGAVVYFASEMILKKSFRIWKSWKGFAVFGVLFAGMICFFAFTGFFGYETRVPEREDVESVAIYEYYYQEEPWLSESDIIDCAIKTHKEIVQNNDFYTVKKYIEEYSSAIHIRYKLKNGDMLVRRYPVSQEKICEIMTELYKSENYRRKILDIFAEDVERFNRVYFGNDNTSFSDENDIKELVEAIKKDVLSLNYMQMLNGQNWELNIGIEYVPKNQPKTNDNQYSICTLNQNINANFKNTVKWLKDNGYLCSMFNNMHYDLAIITEQEWDDRITPETYEGNSYGPRESSYESPKIDDFPDAVRIYAQENKDAIREFVINTGEEFVPHKAYTYYILTVDDGGYLRIEAAFYENTDRIMKLLK